VRTTLRGSPWSGLVSAAIGSCGFFLTYSTAGVALSLGALLALALVRPRAILQTRPWREPVMAVGLLLLAYIALHTLVFSGATKASLSMINHYQELLLAPFLLAFLQHRPFRAAFLRGLLAGAVLLAIAHWATVLDPAYSYVLSSRRISAGFGLATCAFLVLMQARARLNPWPSRVLAAFLALTVLFAVDGRTGYVVLVVLVALAAWIHSPRRWRWAAAAVAPIAVILVALASNAVNSRLAETIAGSQPAGQAGPTTSTGIRIELMRIGLDLSLKYAVTGAGFVNYPAVHEQAARERYSRDPSKSSYLNAEWIRSENPHDEYVMQLVGGGVVALGLFVGWLALAMREGCRARSAAGDMLLGASVAFAVGCLFNSLLKDFVEGHLYMGLLAFLIAEMRNGGLINGRLSRDVGSVVVIATNQIGDVLLSTPLLSSVRETWPEARVEVLGSKGKLGMLDGNRNIDAVVELPPHPGLSWLLVQAHRLWRRYDLAIVTDGSDRAHLLGWLAADCRSGILPASSSSNWWKNALLDYAVTSEGDSGDVHVVTEKLKLLTPWRDTARDIPAITPPKSADLPADIQRQLRPGAVIIHAPSMWRYKQWPVENFRALADELLKRGRQVILTGSSAAGDQECVAALLDLARPPSLLNVAGRLDLNQLAAIMGRAALYIGPDTSISHLAAASGIPSLIIFGPTNPVRWGPLPARATSQVVFQRSALAQSSGNVTVLQAQLPCVPCGRAGCEDHRQSRSDCLSAISVSRVLDSALTILGDVVAPHGTETER
jgi:ADP-heptose:LPS heptosyltransferase/O-antigen ligase